MAIGISGANGICYAAFPTGYDPSRANNTWIYFGSDIAQNAMGALWNNFYSNYEGTPYTGRNDLLTMMNMGANLVRLYDWEPRNKHDSFLDAFGPNGIGVLAPVSNYFLKEGFSNRKTLIPELIKSFSNLDRNDYHSSITGIIIGNEPAVSGFSVDACIQFTKDWIEIEQSMFGGNYRKLPIGHPVDFSLYGGQYPCWGFWDKLLAGLNTGGLSQRLFLAPQTYNSASYLFKTVDGNKAGYVDLTWDRYHIPLLFTEIGLGRDKPEHVQFVRDQLQNCIAYNGAHPDRLLGFCFFQFADKVWMQGTPEGSFGAHSHTNQLLTTVHFSAADFTHWDVDPAPLSDQMTVDVLAKTDLYNAVSDSYNVS
jgi:hypothetical protein